MEFICRDVRNGGCELDFASVMFDLPAERFGQGEELVSRQGGEIALGQFGFDFLELLSQGSDAGFAG